MGISASSARQSVSDLPNEILIEIFVACVEAVKFTLDPKSAPWVLARVCRLWRNICLATPVLWSRLPTIALDRQDVSPWHLTRALALSSPEHLDMSLSLRETEERTSFPLFGIIIPHLDRCRSLALTISYAVLSELADSHRDFQHLEELHLILALPPYRRSPRRTFDVSRSAPLLSRFTASFQRSGDDFDSLDAYVRINWSKLTHLTLECIPFHRVYSILQNTPA